MRDVTRLPKVDLHVHLQGSVRPATVLEVCPTSNVVTGLVGSIEDHPLPRLLDAGLLVTLNSDDPAMFRSPVAGEYATAREVFGARIDAWIEEGP